MRWYSIPELLPPVYRQVKSMEAVAQAEDDVLGGVELEQPSYMELTNQILNNFFIQTCDLDTIQYWENLLEIELYGTETLEERRAQIILYLSGTQAITDPYAKQVLKDMFGDGNWVYEHDPDNNLILNIEIYNAIDDKVRRFLQWFCRVCPAHVQWRSGRYEELPTEVCQTLHVQSMNESWGQVRCVAGMAPLVFLDKDTGAITGRAYPNEIVIDAYFTNQGSSATSDTYIGNGITYTLYDASGNTIPYDATKTYTTVAAFSVNGDTNSIGDGFTGYASYSDSILKGRANGATMMFRLVIRVE